MACKRTYIPTSNISLRDDWGGFNTQPYVTYFSTIMNNIDENGPGTNNRSIVWNTNEYMWQIDVFGTPDVLIRRNTGISAPTGYNTVINYVMMSGDRASVQIEAFLPPTSACTGFLGWYSTASGAGTYFGNTNPWTISYTDTVITNGTYNIYARCS